MKIGILGAGNVGKTLGERWKSVGHEVTYGVRTPGTPGTATVAQAAREADVIVLAVPWGAVRDAIAEAGDLEGKILIDATNPIREDFSGLEIGTNDSAGEFVARLAPKASVVKAFNTIGFNVMADPAFGQVAASLLIAGNSEEAKRVVAALASELGFTPEDSGPIEQSRGLEALAWLWISMAMKHGQGREIAFVLHRR